MLTEGNLQACFHAVCSSSRVASAVGHSVLAHCGGNAADAAVAVAASLAVCEPCSTGPCKEKKESRKETAQTEKERKTEKGKEK